MTGASPTKAIPVTIPVKPIVPRPPMRNSIEGLNQEIERLVLKANGGPQDSEREEEKVKYSCTNSTVLKMIVFVLFNWMYSKLEFSDSQIKWK